jgi:Predicted transcriptional regulator
MREMTEHDQWLKEQLQDADFAAEYLNAAQEDDDPQVYLLALRKVVEARSSLKDVALQSNLSRETLYRTLSARGNPTLKT